MKVYPNVSMLDLPVCMETKVPYAAETVSAIIFAFPGKRGFLTIIQCPVCQPSNKAQDQQWNVACASIDGAREMRGQLPLGGKNLFLLRGRTRAWLGLFHLFRIRHHFEDNNGQARACFT